MATPIDTTEACELLSDPLRRSVLELFRDRAVWPIDELAVELVDRDGTAPSAAGSSATAERTQIELVHNHIPRLVDHGVLEWDSRSGDVVRSDGFDALDRIAELAPDDRQPTVATLTDGN
ncbi:hypothetical protein Halru_2568 [Halovivax ruber XH-70]|uniref:DUF7344 domain-containing protein n=1 Tax=Halovivax ruber (strain DSM 18193 / JCM 13892 / XH-70) TaxID=797302 RepID=L0IEE6_HALRX|nr:hypothetical protein [Halovivax ruber]AGB17149.1 hypothetical protein Halru_2568 [Halovivax ruber XH-70]